MSFEQVIDYVEREGGFATSHYNDDYLDRRVTARMRRVDADSYGDYLDHLREDPDEQAALHDFLSINVTGFFRDPDVWEALRPILADLTDQQRRVRAWSAPCADGREPYSLAMLASEDGAIDERRLSITGTDIDPEALDRARAGEYETTRITDIEAELAPLSNPLAFIDREDDVYTVCESIRDLVSFEEHDLIRGEPKRNHDLVLCRNLFIYIDGAYKRPVFETIGESLRDGGYLVIGKTETVPRELKDDYTAVDKRCRIYRYD
jgi:chemotaxis protein methyltransferase CheR